MLNALLGAKSSHALDAISLLLLCVPFSSTLSHDTKDIQESERLASILKDPSEERKSFWTQRTSLDFDYKACLKAYRKKPIKNICCGQVDEIGMS